MKAELENKAEVPETFYRGLADQVDGQLRIRVLTNGAVSDEFGERLDALEPEIAVEHTDIPERVNRDVLEKVGEEVAARALPEKAAAAD